MTESDSAVTQITHQWLKLKGIEAIGEGMTTSNPPQPCINVYIDSDAQPDTHQIPTALFGLPVVIIAAHKIDKRPIRPLPPL